MAGKKKVAKKPTGMVDVKVKTFRGQPAAHGKVFFTTGILKHPGTLRIPASEVNDIVEVVGEYDAEETDEVAVETPSSDEDFLE